MSLNFITVFDNRDGSVASNGFCSKLKSSLDLGKEARLTKRVGGSGAA